MGYLCANFSLPIGLSVLDLGPMYATDRRQTKASLNASALWGRRHNNEIQNNRLSQALNICGTRTLHGQMSSKIVHSGIVYPHHRSHIPLMY